MTLENYIDNITQQLRRQRYSFRREELRNGKKITESDILSLPEGYSVGKARGLDVWESVSGSLQAIILCPRQLMDANPMHLIYGVQTVASPNGQVQQGVIAIAPYPLIKPGQQEKEWNIHPYIVLLNNGDKITAIGYSGLDDSSKKRGQALSARIGLQVGQTVTQAIDRLIDQYLKSYQNQITLTDMRVIPRTT